MELLSNVINTILQDFGAALFVPFIMIIAGLFVKMKPKDAISSGITLGVAFTGMSLLISYMTGIIGPAADAMLKATGISLPIIDGGWTTMATISWSWPYAFIMFPLMIVINIIMIVLKKTNTFNADLWNVWGKIFTAVGVVGLTGSVPLAFVIAGIQIIIELVVADAHQKRIERLTGIPGVTCSHRMIFDGAILYPIDVLLRKIPFFNRKFDAEALKDKLGVFAENHVLGFILGCLFGLIARYDIPATLTLGIQAATSLTLFPVISKFFMQALSPISEAVSDYMNKRFSGRQLYVGLDWPFMGGASEIWLCVIWSIPLTLIWAVILPGNEILPFAGIINIALAVSTYLVTGGNIPRMFILSIIGIPTYLLVGTAFAPFMTELARTTGAVALEAGQLISNSSIDAPVFTYGLSHFLNFLNGNFIPLIILIVWFVCYYFYQKDLRKEGLEDQSGDDQFVEEGAPHELS